MRSSFINLVAIQVLAIYLPSNAQTISREQALSQGIEFFERQIATSHRANQRGAIAYDIEPSSQIVRHDSVSLSNEAFYVIHPHDASGFVIMSGDERMYPVLAYSDHSDFSTEDMPEAVRMWLEGYAREYTALPQATPTATEEPITNDYITLSQNKRNWMPIQEDGVSPLLGDRDWGQGVPFNNMTPLWTGTTTHCKTGCVATAIAQVMAYHRWPAQGQGVHTYTTPGVDGEITVDFSQSYYDWDNMLDVYIPNEYTATEGDAVALLMRDCGVAMDMRYEMNASGASTFEIPQLIPEHFDYTTDMTYLFESDLHEPVSWHRIVLRELNDKRPVIFSGHGAGSHCFVVDGYQTRSTSFFPYYHVNWGWPSNRNHEYDYRGYYLLSALKPTAEHSTYSIPYKNNYIIINFRPNRDLDDEPLLFARYDRTYTPNPNQDYRIIHVGDEADWYYSFDIMLRKLVGRDYNGTLSLRAVNIRGEAREIFQTQVSVTKSGQHIKDEYLQLPTDIEPDVYTMEWYVREQGSARDSMIYDVSNCHLVICDQAPQLTAEVVSTSSPKILGDGYTITLDVTNHSQRPYYGKILATFTQPQESLQEQVESSYVSIPAGETRQVTISGTFSNLAAVQTTIQFLNSYDQSAILSPSGNEPLTFSALFQPAIPQLQASSSLVDYGDTETSFVLTNSVINKGLANFVGDFRLMLFDEYSNPIEPIGTSYTIDIDAPIVAGKTFPSTDVQITATLPESIPNGDYYLELQARQKYSEQWVNVSYSNSTIRVTDDNLWFYKYSNMPDNYYFIIPRPHYCGTPSFHHIRFITEGDGYIWAGQRQVYEALLIRNGQSAEIKLEAKDEEHSCIVLQGDHDLTSRLVNNTLLIDNVDDDIELHITFGLLQGDFNKDHRISVGDLAQFVAPDFETNDLSSVDLNNNGRIDPIDYQIFAEKIISETTPEKARAHVLGDNDPVHQGYTYVNLGLPEPYDKLLWATCNIGAKYPYEVGDYFAWGETSSDYPYKLDNYEFYDPDDKTGYSKYQGDIDSDPETEVDGLIELLSEDDAAQAQQGGNWRIPCVQEWQALIDNCTMTVFDAGNPQYKGIHGVEFTGPNGNKIFLPETGYYSQTEEGFIRYGCHYWTRNLNANIGWWNYIYSWDVQNAIMFYCSMSPDSSFYQNYTQRSDGLPIRPVIDSEVDLPPLYNYYEE